MSRILSLTHYRYYFIALSPFSHSFAHLNTASSFWTIQMLLQSSNHHPLLIADQSPWYVIRANIRFFHALLIAGSILAPDVAIWNSHFFEQYRHALSSYFAMAYTWCEFYEMRPEHHAWISDTETIPLTLHDRSPLQSHHEIWDPLICRTTTKQKSFLSLFLRDTVKDIVRKLTI